MLGDVGSGNTRPDFDDLRKVAERQFRRLERRLEFIKLVLRFERFDLDLGKALILRILLFGIGLV